MASFVRNYLPKEVPFVPTIRSEWQRSRSKGGRLMEGLGFAYFFASMIVLVNPWFVPRVGIVPRFIYYQEAFFRLVGVSGIEYGLAHIICGNYEVHDMINALCACKVVLVPVMLIYIRFLGSGDLPLELFVLALVIELITGLAVFGALRYWDSKALLKSIKMGRNIDRLMKREASTRAKAGVACGLVYIAGFLTIFFYPSLSGSFSGLAEMVEDDKLAIAYLQLFCISQVVIWGVLGGLAAVIELAKWFPPTGLMACFAALVIVMGVAADDYPDHTIFLTAVLVLQVYSTLLIVYLDPMVIDHEERTTLL